MTRLKVENFVVLGVTLSIITICCQIVFLPLLFSEIDSIRGEFDVEVREAMKMFEDSYQGLSMVQKPGGSIRRQREVARGMVADSTSNGPADHVAAAPTHRARNVVPTITSTSHFSPELRKLAREAELSEYDDETAEDYEDEPEPTLSVLPPAPTATASPPSLSLPTSPPSTRPPRLIEEEFTVNNPIPICPLEENRCPPGPAGPQGQKGTPGINGMDGNDGGPGMDAMDELTPSFPIFCVACPAGPDGKPGMVGPTGKPGLVGAPGIPGPNGKNGQPGAPGGYGSPGKQGQMGIRGEQGSQGLDGVVLISTKGPKGPPGKSGPAGQPGEDGTNNNMPGPYGEPGWKGVAGLQGGQGLPGKRGDTGSPGVGGVNSEGCKCEDMMKKAIEVAENSAYVAVEAVVDSGASTASYGTEIRRNPQKSVGSLPTLEEVRAGLKPTFARQEDEKIEKFAVAPSEIQDAVLVPRIQERSLPEPEEPEQPDEPEIVEEPEVLTGVTHAPLIEPPRAQAPQFKLHAAKFVTASVPARVMGESRRRIRDGRMRKTRNEGTATVMKKRKVKRVKASAFRVADSDDFRNLDETPFTVEKEIARESEKKVEIRRAPVRRRKEKMGKVEKKLKRVRLTPSAELKRQHRENSNILENIAKSLGLIEEPNRKMSKVSIP